MKTKTIYTLTYTLTVSLFLSLSHTHNPSLTGPTAAPRRRQRALHTHPARADVCDEHVPVPPLPLQRGHGGVW